MSSPTEPKSPSPIVSYFVRSLAKVLPEEQRASLAAFDAAVGGTSADHELRRAWRCAEWALQLAGHPEESVIEQRAHEIREAYRLLKDSMYGFAYGVSVRDGVGPGKDVELQWVDRAVAVAKATGAARGWNEVPWKGLLEDLVE